MRHVQYLILFLLGSCVFFSTERISAQNSIPDSFEQILENVPSDSARLDSMNEWMWNLRLNNAPLGIQIGHRAIELAERMDNRYGMAVALESQGVLYDMVGSYEKAVQNYFEALDIWEEFDDPYYLMSGYINLAVLFDRWGDTTKAKKYFEEVIKLDTTAGDGSATPIVLNNLATMYTDIRQYDKAKEYYVQALTEFKKLAEESDEDYSSRIATIENNLGNYYRRTGHHDRAVTYYHQSLEKSKPDSKYKLMSSTHLGLAHVAMHRRDDSKALEHAEHSLNFAKKSGNTERISSSFELLRRLYAKQGNFKKAFSMDTNYLRTREKINELAQQGLVRELEARYQNEKYLLEIENQQLAIEEKNARLKSQRITLMSIGGGMILLLLLIGLMYNRYQLKQRSNRELSEKNQLIEKERKRSDELLLNILPAETARELKDKGQAAAKAYDHVTVLFTDFEDFSLICQALSPEELVNELHELFKKFDEIILKHGLEKIKTIGDAYMAAGGIPTPREDHAHKIIQAAIEIQGFLSETNRKRHDEGRHLFLARCGVHSGPVIAGIVGSNKFAYDIWGDTVNTAARLESAGETGKINISGNTYELINDEYACTYRGKIKAKNKGEIDMYYVDF